MGDSANRKDWYPGKGLDRYPLEVECMVVCHLFPTRDDIRNALASFGPLDSCRDAESQE